MGTKFDYHIPRRERIRIILQFHEIKTYINDNNLFDNPMKKTVQHFHFPNNVTQKPLIKLSEVY